MLLIEKPLQRIIALAALTGEKGFRIHDRNQKRIDSESSRNQEKAFPKQKTPFRKTWTETCEKSGVPRRYKTIWGWQTPIPKMLDRKTQNKTAGGKPRPKPYKKILARKLQTPEGYVPQALTEEFGQQAQCPERGQSQTRKGRSWVANHKHNKGNRTFTASATQFMFVQGTVSSLRILSWTSLRAA